MSKGGIRCKGCGCKCNYCDDHSGLHLHVEIENLKQRLLEKESHILKMETNFLKEAEKFPNGEFAAISEELLTWQDKYSRLHEAHKRVQKVNQNLEDKLLKIVDKCETEKNALSTEVANLTRRLVDEKYNVARLQEENERYKNDVNLAIQLLQCKPSNFVPQKYDLLPTDLQQKVRTYVTNKRKSNDLSNGLATSKTEMKTIKVPIPTYPPTAMVYSINKSPLIERDEEKNNQNHQPVDIVSAAIMAKVLEEREKERSQTKHCDTCCCPIKKLKHSKSTQTLIDCHVNSSSIVKSNSNSVTTSSNILKLSNVKETNLIKSTKINNVKETLHFTGQSFDPSIKLSDSPNLVEKQNSNCISKDINNSGDYNKNNNNVVAEAVLVDLDLSSDESPVDSLATSESSIFSWQSNSKHVNVNNINMNGNKSDTGSVDLISFEATKEANQNLISNNNLIKTTPPETQTVKANSAVSSGPRHCSVRVQIGSNNILLDNAIHPNAPVLYKGRHQNPISNTDPLVHLQRSRSTSSNSSSEELHHQPRRKSIFHTETEI